MRKGLIRHKEALAVGGMRGEVGLTPLPTEPVGGVEATVTGVGVGGAPGGTVEFEVAGVGELRSIAGRTEAPGGVPTGVEDSLGGAILPSEMFSSSLSMADVLSSPSWLERGIWRLCISWTSSGMLGASGGSIRSL